MERNFEEVKELRPYVKPEAEQILLCLNENIAGSGEAFDGEDDEF